MNGSAGDRVWGAHNWLCQPLGRIPARHPGEGNAGRRMRRGPEDLMAAVRQRRRWPSARRRTRVCQGSVVERGDHPQGCGLSKAHEPSQGRRSRSRGRRWQAHSLRECEWSAYRSPARYLTFIHQPTRESHRQGSRQVPRSRCCGCFVRYSLTRRPTTWHRRFPLTRDWPIDTRLADKRHHRRPPMSRRCSARRHHTRQSTRPSCPEAVRSRTLLRGPS